MTSKKTDFMPKIYWSITLFLAGLVALIPWAKASVSEYTFGAGFSSQVGISAWDIACIMIMGSLFLGSLLILRTTPPQKQNIRSMYVAAIVVGVIVLGYTTTALSKYIPFPPDSPGCCTSSSPHYRGLPIAYEVRYSEFIQSPGKPPMQYGQITFYSGKTYLWDVAIWTGTYAYIAYVWLLIRAHKHKK